MASNLQCKRVALPFGGTGLFTEDLAYQAWSDSTLLQSAWETPGAFWTHSQNYHAGIPQVQFALVDPSGAPVGGIVLTPTVDGQVGECMVAIHNFLEVTHRGSLSTQRMLLRMALQECRDEGYRWLLITRLMPDGSQRTTYKEVLYG